MPTLDDLPGALQIAADAHVDACSSWLFISEELPVEQWPESPAVGAYDGCSTCILREGISAALPVFRAHVVAYLRAAGHQAAAADLQAALTGLITDPAPRPADD